MSCLSLTSLHLVTNSAHFHMSQPLVLVLTQMSLIQAGPTRYFEIQFVIILPFIKRYIKRPISSRFHHQNLVCICLILVRSKCPTHLDLLGLIILTIFRGKQKITKLLIVQISTSSCVIRPF